MDCLSALLEFHSFPALIVSHLRQLPWLFASLTSNTLLVWQFFVMWTTWTKSLLRDIRLGKNDNPAYHLHYCSPRCSHCWPDCCLCSPSSCALRPLAVAASSESSPFWHLCFHLCFAWDQSEEKNPIQWRGKRFLICDSWPLVILVQFLNAKELGDEHTCAFHSK